MLWTSMDSPWGELVIAEEEGAITHLLLKSHVQLPADKQGDSTLLREAVKQMRAYLAGECLHFDLPLNPKGTPFQRQVWEALMGIEPGSVITYAQLAQRVGRPSAFRAVGNANGRNPIWIVQPCHRVVGSSGALTGYAGGVAMKRDLLALEGAAGFGE